MKLIDVDEYKEKLYAMMPKFDEEDDKKCIEGQTIFFCISVLDDMPTITPPPNDPLTLEELREMDGDPVYCVSDYTTLVNNESEYHIHHEEWGIVSSNRLVDDVNFIIGTAYMYYFEKYGVTWFAYRRKP